MGWRETEGPVVKALVKPARCCWSSGGHVHLAGHGQTRQKRQATSAFLLTKPVTATAFFCKVVTDLPLFMSTPCRRLDTTCS